MQYLVTVTGDMNDGDCVTKTNLININDRPFKNWKNFEDIPLTYKELFEAFAQCLKEYNKEYDSYNWVDEAQSIILKKLCDKLFLNGLIKDSSILSEIFFEFIPYTCDYPLHTIEEIKMYTVSEILKVY